MKIDELKNQMREQGSGPGYLFPPELQRDLLAAQSQERYVQFKNTPFGLSIFGLYDVPVFVPLLGVHTTLSMIDITKYHYWCLENDHWTDGSSSLPELKQTPPWLKEGD